MTNSTNHKPRGAFAFLTGFVYAFKGVYFLMSSQRNVWVHIVATLLVVFGGFYYSVSAGEWHAIILSIGIVFAAEAFNTAIEELVNKVYPGYDKSAGRIKDLAAGAVLFTAIAAAIIGFIIFVPKIFT